MIEAAIRNRNYGNKTTYAVYISPYNSRQTVAVKFLEK
jgi:hypothetical protein